MMISSDTPLFRQQEGQFNVNLLTLPMQGWYQCIRYVLYMNAVAPAKSISALSFSLFFCVET